MNLLKLLAIINFIFLLKTNAQPVDNQRFISEKGYKTDTLALKPTALMWEIEVAARFVCTDISLNAFVISEKNEILSFDPAGKPVGRYSNDKLGSAASIDASAAGAIVVWYPDFHTAVWLDAALTELGRLDLRKLDLANVRTISAGSDQSIWVYDEINFQLKNIDNQGKLRYSSQFLNQTIGKPPVVTQILENEQQVFVSDSTVGFFVFDRFAQFQKTIHADKVRDFSISENKLRYWDDNNLKEIFIKNPSMKRAVPSPLKMPPTNQAFAQKRRIYVIRPDKLQVWILGL